MSKDNILSNKLMFLVILLLYPTALVTVSLIWGGLITKYSIWTVMTSSVILIIVLGILLALLLFIYTSSIWVGGKIFGGQGEFIEIANGTLIMTGITIIINIIFNSFSTALGGGFIFDLLGIILYILLLWFWLLLISGIQGFSKFSAFFSLIIGGAFYGVIIFLLGKLMSLFL